jgi:hypothetical protein
MDIPDNSCAADVDRILDSDARDVEKLAQAFDCVTAFIVRNAEREIALHRALQDREALVKTQIKMETMRHARAVFEECYRRVQRSARQLGDPTHSEAR